MTEDATSSLARCQVGLFGALVGVLIAKRVVTRDEIVVALNVVEETESDPLVKMIYRVLGEVILKETEGSSEVPPFELRVISGGRSSYGGEVAG